MPAVLVDDLGEWVEDSVARLGRDRYSTAKQARMVARFAEECGIEGIADIRPRLVTAHLVRLAKAGASCQTRANTLAAIRSFVRWAVETERLPANPIEHVRIARRQRGGTGAEAFTAEEVARLVDIARSDMESPNLRLSKGADARMALYLTLAATGLRLGEAKAQRWADLDLDRREMTVSHDKARRRDTVPLCDEAVEILRWWRERSGGGELVFPSLPTHRTLERDLARCGIESGRGQWHRFRKTAITLRAEAGVPIWDLTRIARHVDPKTTLRYVTARDEAMTRAAQSMPSILRFVYPRFDAEQRGSEKNLGKISCRAPSRDETVPVLPAPSRGSAQWSRGDSNPRPHAEPLGLNAPEGMDAHGTTAQNSTERHRIE